MKRLLLVLLLVHAAELYASFSLNVTAVNGSVSKNPDKELYELNETVSLIPHPNTGYCFDHWTGNIANNNLVGRVTMNSNKAVTANFVTWHAPIGIPEPEFGIKETYRMYDEAGNQAPGLTYRDSPSGGTYTHYIDCTDSNATDTNNPFGTVAIPRKTFYWSTVSPYSYPAGSVIEVHHGPYNNGGVKGRTWDFQGTAQYPIFLRGVDQADMPKFTMGTRLKGQYVVLENLEFDGAGLLGASTPMITTYSSVVHDHIAIRCCTIHNNPANMAITLNTGSRYILVYANRLYDNFNADGWDSLDEHDYNGVCIYAGEIGQTTEVSNIWITDNYAYHNQGDGVQFYWDDSYPTTRANNVYIGRNIFWQNRENGVDIKHGDNIIVSQNFISGSYIRDSCYGQAIGFGAEGPASNNWVIYNEITDSVRGAGGFHSKTEPYIIGNVFHDMLSAPYSGGITGGSVGTIINNTFYNLERGVNDQEVFLSDAVIINNIFSNCSVYHIYSRNTCYNNLLYQNGDPVVFNGGGTNINGVTLDPLFVDAANGNFNLNSGSPAIDAGTSSGVVKEVFDRFEQLYGIDIRKDIEGGVRPCGAEWDIGAYEWGSTPADPEPGTEPDTDTQPSAEPETLIPDITALVVMNNIIKSGRNQSALIRCDMKESGKLTVKIYDAKGKEIITVCDEQREAGRHEFVWAGQDSAGNTVGSGIYIVHLKSGEYSETKKIAIIK